MLKKLIFTSVIFVTIMVIFGIASIRETARLSAWQDGERAEAIEQGAAVYAQNCATCHGRHAKAELCFSTFGDEIACSGRPLNSYELLCGDPSPRLDEVGWVGFKDEYIRAITTVGNQDKGMPPFGEEYRYDTFTALSGNKIDEVTAYILNFEPLPCFPIPQPTSRAWVTSVADLPIGDATHGAELYDLTYACSACHGDFKIEGSNAVGPWSGNFKDLDTRKEGYSAADYDYESILLPNAHISPDCPTGPCSSPSGMPDYRERMSLQAVADVMAYLGINPKASTGVEINWPSE